MLVSKHALLWLVFFFVLHTESESVKAMDENAQLVTTNNEGAPLRLRCAAAGGLVAFAGVVVALLAVALCSGGAWVARRRKW